MPAPKARSASAKTKVVNGRTVSAKSRTGSAACSQAMSDWVRTRKEGTTPASVYAQLGKCRSMARAGKQATQHRAAGNEAKAQRYEALAAGKKGPISAKDRLARAKELRAELNAKRAGAGAAPAPVAAKAPLRKPRDPEIVAARKKVADDIRSQYRTAEQNVLSNPDYHRQSPALSGGLKDIRKSTYRQDVKAGVEKAKSRLPLRTTVEERRLDDKTQIAIRTDAAGSAGYRRGLRSVFASSAQGQAANPIAAKVAAGAATNRPALSDADKAAVSRVLAPSASLLQKMRQARYMSTIESGKGKGGIDRESLRQERERLGINADSIRAARANQKLIAEQAAAKGFRPNDVVSAGRKSAMDEIRDKYAKGGSMLSRGAGYYPSPGERLAAKADYGKRMAEPTSVIPKNVFLTSRAARANYRRDDLPETRQHLNAGDARKAAAVRIKAEKIAKREADQKAAQRAANVASLQSRGKQTPERVALAEKARKFKAVASVNRTMGGFGMSRSEANAATKAGILKAAPAAQSKPPPASSVPAGPRPSLKEQAAAHRAAKYAASTAKRGRLNAPADPADRALDLAIRAKDISKKARTASLRAKKAGKDDVSAKKDAAYRANFDRNEKLAVRSGMRQRRAPAQSKVIDAKFEVVSSAPSPAAPAVPRPSLRQQADAHRAAKGTTATERIAQARRVKAARAKDVTTSTTTKRAEAPVSGSFIKDRPELFFSGNTFAHKDTLKSLGARWNADRKEWAATVSGSMRDRGNVAMQLNNLAKRGVKIEYERTVSTTKRNSGKGVKARVASILRTMS